MGATPSKEPNVFDFYGLPRELRDMVHGFALEDCEQKLGCGLVLKASNIPPTNLLLVSKQFKAEVEECATRHKRLTITGHQAYIEEGPCGPCPHQCSYESAVLPGPATKMQVVTLDITVVTLGRLCYVRQWVPPVLSQLRSLRSLDIKLLTEMSRSARDAKEWTLWLEERKEWWSREQTKTLKVFDAGTGHACQVLGVLNGRHEAELAIWYEQEALW